MNASYLLSDFLASRIFSKTQIQPHKHNTLIIMINIFVKTGIKLLEIITDILFFFSLTFFFFSIFRFGTSTTISPITSYPFCNYATKIDKEFLSYGMGCMPWSASSRDPSYCTGYIFWPDFFFMENCSWLQRNQ